MPFAATWMVLERVILNEVSQTEKEKYCMTSLVCGILQGVIQMNLITKQRLADFMKEILAAMGKNGGRDS